VAGALNTTGARVFDYRVYNPGRAIIVRSGVRVEKRISAADRIALTDWLVKQLDQSPTQTLSRRSGRGGGWWMWRDQ
jgi:hypothetical protein